MAISTKHALATFLATFLAIAAIANAERWHAPGKQELENPFVPRRLGSGGQRGHDRPRNLKFKAGNLKFKAGKGTPARDKTKKPKSCKGSCSSSAVPSSVPSLSSAPSQSPTGLRELLGCPSPEQVTALPAVTDMEALITRCLDNGNSCTCGDGSVNCPEFGLKVECLNTSEVKSMPSAFLNQNSFNGDLGLWDTSQVTDMSNMFLGASSFNQPLDSFITSKVTTMAGMFKFASRFNQPLGNFDTSQVTYMSNMFNSASSFNQPLDNFDTSKVTTMAGMFYFASSFNQCISSWVVDQANRYLMLTDSGCSDTSADPFQGCSC